jgi:hypothetical protein
LAQKTLLVVINAQLENTVSAAEHKYLQMTGATTPFGLILAPPESLAFDRGAWIPAIEKSYCLLPYAQGA